MWHSASLLWLQQQHEASLDALLLTGSKPADDPDMSTRYRCTRSNACQCVHCQLKVLLLNNSCWAESLLGC